MKGQLYTLESAIAILMILFIVVFLFQNPPATPEFERINYKMKVHHALKVLDETGQLRDDVIDSNTTSIESKLNPYIPDFLSYNVTIYNETTNITEKPSFTGDMISVSYFIAGDIDDYRPRDVRVYLWGFD